MNLREQLQEKIDGKTKPVGALGILEKIALKAGMVQNSLSPEIHKPHIIVFAGDHGIAAKGKVNPYPQAVTAQMVLNFVKGGAAINVFTKQYGIGLTVVDAGVNYDFDASLPIIHAKINKGTQDYSEGQAMSEEEMQQAIEKGKEIVEEIFNDGCNTIGFGEMGIGNTSSAALIMHHYTRLPLEDCVGRGTGANDEQLKIKIETLNHAATLHKLTESSISSTDLLIRIGGFEMAMMTGAFLKASELNMIIVVDGFIASAALMIAQDMDNKILDSCLFAHCSDEQGHRKMLEHLEAEPLLQLGMRLGEGTGAALAIPVLQGAVNFLNNMASFESAGVANKS
ncbi:MAG: nicotinate-nucleotide--dimethylbenzimidazole phosphoribosyltransferase [Ferruginibacter sp.]|nr:nicotinate-nucleotide--dimethylbenzimidazole phosphoribosyltransferase [Ferruginibacter sp.]